MLEKVDFDAKTCVWINNGTIAEHESIMCLSLLLFLCQVQEEKNESASALIAQLCD